MPTQKVQPQTLFQRALGGNVLYNHVVVVEAQRLIFISGQLARNKAGEIVGPRDMRAQIKQVGENLRNAAAAVIADQINLIDMQGFEHLVQHVRIGGHRDVLIRPDLGVTMRQ